MRWILVLVISMMARQALFAQTINLSDSLREVFRQRITPSFKFDTRNSFITGSTAKVYGLKAGVSFGKRLSIGLGYNFIGTRLRENTTVDDIEIKNAEIRMNYVAPYVEYGFFQRGPWEIGTSIQLGVGSSFHRYSENGNDRIIHRGRVILYEPVMSCEYKIFKLIGVGVGCGYRIMLKSNRAIEQQFTSPVYALRVRLIFDELYRRYKKYSTNEGEKNQTP
jgi:hypothetical protein